MRFCDPPQLVELELLGGGQLLPQRRVAILDVRRHLPRVDVLDEAPADLQVEQAAGDVLGGDVEVHLPLAVGERRVALRRLDVDDERRQRTGVAAEQRVRQRAVAPEEPGQVEADEQPDEGVEEALAEIRDAQAAARQQRAVRQRVVEVAGDEQAVSFAGPFGDGGDDVDGRQLVLVEAAQQPVLAEHEVIGKFLDDVGPAAVPLPQLDEADDVAVQPGHLVDARQRPLGEVGAEREQTEVGMLRGRGELQAHRSAPLGRT